MKRLLFEEAPEEGPHEVFHGETGYCALLSGGGA
jgi:hypothetical protein